MSKRTMIFLLAGCVGCIMLLFLFFLKEERQLDTFKPSKTYEIHVILKALQNPPDFWRVVEQGISTAVGESDVQYTVRAPQMERDVDMQIKLMEESIAAQPDAILLAASDYERLAPLCRKAIEVGIPVITLDSDVNEPARRCFIGTDNVQMGAKLAQLVQQLTDPTEPIGVMGHVRGTSTAAEREQGLLDGLAQSRERVAAIDYCEGDEGIAKERTIQMLTEHPEITCMVGLNESSALGVANAVTELGLEGKVKVIACDSSEKQIRFMEQGVIQAFVIQNPFNMGYLGMKTTVGLLKGQSFPEKIYTDSVIIQKQDLYRAENQKLLFPFT